MPNRIVREGIISSRRMADLVKRGGWEAEVFYRRLLNRVDDFGRYTADPTLLRTDLFPRQLDLVREVNMERNLAHCRDARLVRLYQANNEPYLVILSFRQRSRASTSKFPPPPDGLDEDDGHVSDTRPSPDGHPPPYSETETETETNTPKPPQAGGIVSVAPLEQKAKPRKRIKPDDPMPPIPPELDTADFRDEWQSWLTHRRQQRKPVTPEAARRSLEKLSRMGAARAVMAIRESVANNWAGIFEPKQPLGGNVINPKGLDDLLEDGAIYDPKRVDEILDRGDAA